MTVTLPAQRGADSVRDAYEVCAEITRRQARNFSYGIRLLPPARRAALSAVYAFARRADDIGDDPTLPAPEKLVRLAGLRADLARLGPQSADPVLVALDDAARRLPIPLDALDELVDGIEMDVRGVRYDDFDALVGYCRRVAGTIGRLCVAVCGTSAPAEAGALADALGIALQQTNILRDVREDLGNGRVYLPAADLAAYGVELRLEPDGSLGGPRDALLALLQAGAERAERWYETGLPVLDLLSGRGRACCAAMSGIYRDLNRRIALDPSPVLTRRVSLSGRDKAGVAVRSLLGVTP